MVLASAIGSCSAGEVVGYLDRLAGRLGLARAGADPVPAA